MGAAWTICIRNCTSSIPSPLRCILVPIPSQSVNLLSHQTNENSACTYGHCSAEQMGCIPSPVLMRSLCPHASSMHEFQPHRCMHATKQQIMLDPHLQVYGPDGLGKSAMGGHPRRHSRHALSSALDKAGDPGISAHAPTCLCAALILTCAARMQTAMCAILLSVACLSRMSCKRPPWTKAVLAYPYATYAADGDASGCMWHI